MSENDIRALWRSITLRLIEKKLTVTCMESATSGQIASLITDTEGASSIFKGSYVTYSNDEKIRLGVRKETIDLHSVYSAWTALEMANACREAFKADIGIGVTGTMGNIDPANSAFSVPGKLYFAININGSENAYTADIPAKPSRLMYKLAAAELIGEALIKLI